MIRSIAAVIGQVVEAAGGVIGYRRGTEEPGHSVQKLTDHVEIRRYGDRIAAETTVTAEEVTARNAGFRRLARYIFGANQDRTKIAMTAPVAQHPGRQSGEKLSATGPVSQVPIGDQAPVDDQQWVIRFFMPADTTLESLPQPDDAAVRLVTVPPETLAVRRFAGSRSRRAVARQTAALMTTLRETGWGPTARPAAWFYDPPWTVPALRRNEIAVAVEPVS